MSSQLALPGRITPTGLQLPAGLSYDDWLKAGVVLRTIEGAVLWWVGDWYNYGERKYGERAAQAIGGEVDLAAETVRAAGWVAGRVEIVRRRTNLSWSHHQEVAALEPKEQDRLLDRAEHESLTRAELRAAVRDLKRIALPPPPRGEYRVILADPPWDYDNSGFEQSAAQHYPTVPTGEIAALRPPAAADAVLFLWATSPLLPDAQRVMEAWGFAYKASFVWVKDRAPGIGWFVRTRHELLLVGVRGAIGHPSAQPDSIIDGKVAEHSHKPEAAYGLIESMYDGPYVELFARRARAGWHAWGNEVVAA